MVLEFEALMGLLDRLDQTMLVQSRASVCSNVTRYQIVGVPSLIFRDRYHIQADVLRFESDDV